MKKKNLFDYFAKDRKRIKAEKNNGDENTIIIIN